MNGLCSVLNCLVSISSNEIRRAVFMALTFAFTANYISEIQGLSNCYRLSHLSLMNNKITRIANLDHLPLKFLNLVSKFQLCILINRTATNWTSKCNHFIFKTQFFPVKALSNGKKINNFLKRFSLCLLNNLLTTTVNWLKCYFLFLE